MEDRRDCKSERWEGEGRGLICLIVKEAWPFFSREPLLHLPFRDEIECCVCCDNYFSFS